MKEPQFWTIDYQYSKTEKMFVPVKIPITARRQAEIEAWAHDLYGDT